MNSQRSHYLNLVWKSYPTKPFHHLQSGRVIELQNHSWGEQKIAVYNNGQSQLWLIPEQWHDILVAGDWISWLADQEKILELTLLAPNWLEDIKQDDIIISEKLKHQKLWNQFIFEVRNFFTAQNFIELQTPTLTVCPGTEPTLDVFSTEFFYGKEKRKFYLPTSPELSLKKALAQGVLQPFEIRPCFRNNEMGPHHFPEFWMIEWYRGFCDLSQIKKDVQNLIVYLIEKMGPHFKVHDSNLQIPTFTIAELFKKYLDFNLTPKTTAIELKLLAQKHQIATGDCHSFDDLFFLIFLEKIESQFSKEPLFVENYPPSQAALARLTAEGWGDRFEFYWQGLEIANAFHELNDPNIQRLRFQEDLEKKKLLGKEILPIDEGFLRALDQGMPPAAGIALGLDRLFMALKGAGHFFYPKRLL